MAKCELCKKKIEYNHFIKRYGKVYHPECWDNYLAMKREEKKKPLPFAEHFDINTGDE